MTTSTRVLGALVLGCSLTLAGCSGEDAPTPPVTTTPTTASTTPAATSSASPSPSESSPSAPSPTVSQTPTAEDPPAASATPDPTRSATPTATPTDEARGRPTTVVVEIDEVRNGCIYGTTAEGERWGLRGGDVEDLVIGERVRISGVPDDTRDEACPDGMPFLVVSWVPAG